LARGSRALLFVAALATTSVVRAQDLSRVQLEWLGPESCAVAGDVLARARASVDPTWSSTEAMAVTVRVRGARDGGLEVSFEAQRSSDTVRRTLSVRSCEEAKRATALLIALSLEEVVPDESAETAGPVQYAALEPKQPVRIAANEPARAAQTSAELDSKRNAEPDPKPMPTRASEPKPRNSEPESEPARSSEGPPVEELGRARDRPPNGPPRGPLLVAATAGLEAPVLEVVDAVFSASVGFRFLALQLDLGASYWLPVAQELNTVHVVINQIGASFAACHWFSFGRFELAPSAKLLLVRLGATLNGRQAEPRAWLRAAPGARLGLWLTRQLALQVSVEALVSLTRPSVTTGQGDVVEPPRLGAGAEAGLMWSL
jgi:hypothetical protein